jgi:hypothetical protein
MSNFQLNILLIGDFKTKKIIGIHKSTDYSPETLKKVENLFKFVNKYEARNKTYFDNYAVFYTVSKENIFFACACPKDDKNLQENSVYEFFEDLTYQNIHKLTDKNGELNNVGKQNLQYLIEKYQENNTNSNTKNDTSKMSQVNKDIGDITIGMKNNIKKMVNNVESVRELENKAEKINNSSLLFRNDSELLRKQAQWRNRKIKLLIGASILIVVIYAFYKIF